MQIIAYSSITVLDAVEAAWNRFAADGLYFTPSFSELRTRLQAEKPKFRLLMALDNSQIAAMACFIYEDAQKYYHVGGHKLFCLPVKMVTLFGSCVLGQVSENIIQEFFNIIIKEGGFDLIDVGRAFVDSPLYRAVNTLHQATAWEVARKKQFWWLIQLPDSFDAYIASLPERTRRHIARDCRKFERECPGLRTFHRPEEIDIFLRDAGQISRLTYQWELSYGLRDDEAARQHLVGLAERGMLRCYISYLRGEPCAFGWGDLTHGKFYFRQTGYDPKFRKLSPGTALMMRIIKDMIDNTHCRVFHFQWGGEDGYKSRLATESHVCVSMQVAQIKRPYSLVIALLDWTINLGKNSVGLVVERGPLKTRLRSMLRRHGIGTF